MGNFFGSKLPLASRYPASASSCFARDRIERVADRLRVARKNTFGRERGERLDGALVRGQAHLVDRHVERLAHADVVHRRLHRVQHVVVDRALRLVHVIFRQAQTIDPCRRRNVVVQRVDLARLVQIHHRRRVFHGIERDRFEPHVLRIPILRIADVDELVVRLPGLQRECAARDDVLRLRPCLAVGLDGLARDGAEKLMRDQPGKKRHGLRERELDGSIVDGRHADVFRFAFALVISLRAFDVVGEVRGSRGERRREPSAQRIHEVVRGNRIAVRPFRVAKIKGEFGVVAVRLPSLG